jgi:peptidoglycan hydrolase-like protein with peptidoglycan-binding domain
MRTMTTAACALALGFAWAAAPAIAQESTKDKAERKADQIEREADQKADRIRDAADDKSGAGSNKVERAWEKTKDKTREMTDKVKDTMGANGRSSADVRAAQQALQDKGFDPGPIDGVMGPRTTAAIEDFQQRENLTVTGTLDADTQSRLMASTSPAASPATAPKGTNPKRQTQ